MRDSDGSGTLVFWFMLAAALAVNFLGALNGLFPQDSALYASVSRHMAETGNFTDLFRDGRDWLDKPHFPFWAAALSMKALGVSVFAYKLPAFLFFALSVLYTYLLGKDLYGVKTARLAALILASSMHAVVSNSDVRAEPYLMGLIAGAVFHWHRARAGRWLPHLVAGSVFAACAVMTKGVFVLIPALGAVAGDALLRRRPWELFRARWLLALVLVAVFILPEVYAVYTQFDLHPEKVVFGRTGVSGVRFFFWDSQFGRFANTGPIKGKGDPFFFLHTVLWAFAPWGAILYPAVLRKAWSAWRGENREHLMLSAAIPLFLVFSISRFQLPHYTNILFPFFSVMVADLVGSLKPGRAARALEGVQYLTVFVMAAGMVFLQLFFRPGQAAFFAVSVALVPALAWVAWRFEANGGRRTVALCAGFAAALGFYANTVFIPALLSYQACSKAADFVDRDPLKRAPAVLEVNPFIFEFRLDRPVLRLEADRMKPGDAEGALVYTDDRGLSRLRDFGFEYRVVESWRHFERLTKLTAKFLNHATRDKALENRYLVEIE